MVWITLTADVSQKMREAAETFALIMTMEIQGQDEDDEDLEEGEEDNGGEAEASSL